jgi:hypothetical protein
MALNLKSKRRGPVYEALVHLFRTDPILKREIKPLSWHVYLGDRPDDAQPFGEGELPAVEILPFGQGATPESNTRQNSPLGIRITIATDGLDALSLIALWEAFEDVVFPGDGGRSIIATLQAAYPGVISISLSSPAIDPNPQGLGKNVMAAVGTITVNMTTRK